MGALDNQGWGNRLRRLRQKLAVRPTVLAQIADTGTPLDGQVYRPTHSRSEIVHFQPAHRPAQPGHRRLSGRAGRHPDPGPDAQ